MEHRLIREVEEAPGWSGPEPLGEQFTRGRIAHPDVLERLLTANRLLDMVMRRSLTNPQFRCFRGGEELHPRAYFSQDINRRGQSIRMVNKRRLGHLLAGGATLVLDQANVFDPTMEVACRAVQWWSRERVQVNVYLTTNDASGFDQRADQKETSWNTRRRQHHHRSAARFRLPVRSDLHMRLSVRRLLPVRRGLQLSTSRWGLTVSESKPAGRPPPLPRQRLACWSVGSGKDVHQPAFVRRMRRRGAGRP